MNNSYVDNAKERIKDPKILSIVASKRATQLARGGRATLKSLHENFLDIALREVSAGNVVPERIVLEDLPFEEEKPEITE